MKSFNLTELSMILDGQARLYRNRLADGRKTSEVDNATHARFLEVVSKALRARYDERRPAA